MEMEMETEMEMEMQMESVSACLKKSSCACDGHENAARVCTRAAVLA